jgi:hypothetical protein
MQVTTRNNLDLNVLELPYHVRFAWNKKRGVRADHWFTPSGKCKVYIGALSNEHVGFISKEEYDTLMVAMSKCDILTDARDYYTTGNESIMILHNMQRILHEMNEEYEARKDEWL